MLWEQEVEHPLSWKEVWNAEQGNCPSSSVLLFAGYQPQAYEKTNPASSAE